MPRGKHLFEPFTAEEDLSPEAFFASVGKAVKGRKTKAEQRAEKLKADARARYAQKYGEAGDEEVNDGDQ